MERLVLRLRWLIRVCRLVGRIGLVLLLVRLVMKSWWWNRKRVKDRGIRVLSWGWSLRVLVRVTCSRLILLIRLVTTR